MLNTLRKILAVTGAGLVMTLIPAVAVHALDPDVKGNLNCGSNFKLDNAEPCPVEGGTQKIQDIVTLIINLVSVIVGIIAVVMIIVGGFKYTTSGGEPGNITGAKNTIIYAVIGLVVIALAQFLVQFVLNKVNS